MNTEKQLADVIEYLKERLPHGSGIDCDWTFSTLKNGKVLARNSFHCMNDVGYYVGFQDFTVIFDPAIGVHDFKLRFNGSQARARRYALREYLEDTIYSAFPVAGIAGQDEEPLIEVSDAYARYRDLGIRPL